jgi:hypothetical protein
MMREATRDGPLGTRYQPAGPLPSELGGIAELAATLEPPAPHELPDLRRDEAAYLLDGLLVRVAHARGAIDVAMGELLADLDAGGRLIALGYSGIADYGREALGLGDSTARNLARLARALRERPLLRAAVWRGEVSSRKAETILAVASGDDEAAWVERARRETVRALRAAVRTTVAEAPEEDEIWSRLEVSLTPEHRLVVDEAMELAGKALDRPGAPKWQKLEAICSEYLAEHPIEPDPSDRDLVAHRIRDLAEREALKAWLEKEGRNWDFLESVPAMAAEASSADVQREAEALDARLRELAGRRAGWDALVGHLAMLVRMCGLARDMRFVSFAHYCEERLGMSARAAGQRIALARRLYELPRLRDAFKEGRISYVKTREVARVATGRTEAEWMAKADGMTCIALRREIDSREEAQMCSAGRIAALFPDRVAVMVAETIRAVRKASGKWVSPGEALAVASAHFIRAWQHELRERTTPQKRALARDRHRCTVPGCSRVALHAHHIEFRSAGGTDGLENLTSLCLVHHLHGIHGGHLKVTGTAPDRLVWEGVKTGADPPVRKRAA